MDSYFIPNNGNVLEAFPSLNRAELEQAVRFSRQILHYAHHASGVLLAVLEQVFSYLVAFFDRDLAEGCLHIPQAGDIAVRNFEVFITDARDGGHDLLERSAARL